MNEKEQIRQFFLGTDGALQFQLIRLVALGNEAAQGQDAAVLFPKGRGSGVLFALHGQLVHRDIPRFPTEGNEAVFAKVTQHLADIACFEG